MTLNEDTIIYINTNPEKLDISLIQGSMTVDTMNRKKSEVEKINIVHGDEVIRLEKSLISLGKKNSSSALQLELKDGEAKLSKADRDYALRKGSTVISKKDFIRELEIQSANTGAERQTLFQSFKDRQARQGSINGVQIVKSGDQFLVFGQNEKGGFLEAITDRFSALGNEVGSPDELKDRSRILGAALASLGMNSLKNVRTDDRITSSLTDESNNENIIIFPSNGSSVDISEMKTFTFSWKNPGRSRLFRIRLYRKDDKATVFEKLLDTETYSVEDFTLLKRGFYRFSLNSEDGTFLEETHFQIRLKEIDSGVKFTSPEKIYVD